jgi:multisubunit Na+/H+ antiporter MnhB subunit
MEFIDIPTEQTTAITDLFLALVCGFLIYSLWPYLQRQTLRARIWILAFAFLGLAGLLGFIAHGFKMSEAANRIWWMPLNLSLGLTVSLFAVGVIHDLAGKRYSLPALPILMGLGVLFFLVTLLIPGSFLVFIAYEALAMLFALVAYIYLQVKRQFPGALVMAAGVCVSIIAAAIQATHKLSFTLVWEFDHNATFHLVQILGLGLLLLGLQQGFKAKRMDDRL